jgi:hypothetical protein
MTRREQQHLWYIANRDRIRTQQKQYCAEHKNLGRDRRRVYYLKNRERLLEYSNRYYMEHRKLKD